MMGRRWRPSFFGLPSSVSASGRRCPKGGWGWAFRAWSVVFHRQVGHAALFEFFAEGGEAEFFVEGELVGLGGEVEPRFAAGAGEVHGKMHQRGGDALAAGRSQDSNAADLDVLGQENDAQHADDI